MTEPVTHRPVHGSMPEKSVEEILAAACPLPFGDEMIIEELTDEEQRVFLDAIANA